ncbi:SDR family NAD(P)-dependent oxidoreductase [Mucilaginibacter sp. 22184]|uniref:SDR family NAD(P)-dependent oxidoreductase n=1 Tax=Mucilaginibacter sp. 22184 TaxID=3453887 RepID=UPI003F872DC1
MNDQQVWFVTGASQGIGLVLVKRLLAEGYKVVATTRKINELKENVGDLPGFLPLEVDLASEQSVTEAISRTVEKFGRLDAVVNNAGFGMLGALEELSLEEIKTEFEVNVFATINVIRQALPQLRRQGSGHIMNVTSIAGWKGDSGASVYNSSKYAIEGLSDALAGELLPLGIKVTAIAPGPFRTNFLGKGSVHYADPAIADYEHIHQHKQWLDENQHGKQLGDPEKAPDVFIKVFNTEQPPVHVLMGSDAVRIVNSQLQRLQDEISAWEAVSVSTDFKENRS